MKAPDKDPVTAAAGTRDRNAMWAVRRTPTDLTGDQRTSLAAISATDKTLDRAYLLKEQLREVFRAKVHDGRTPLAGRPSSAGRSRSREFVKPAAAFRRYRQLILNTLDHGRSNARSEATNTNLRALTSRAYGFHSPDASSAWPC